MQLSQDILTERQGYHVQITARSEADLDPASIMKKVADSSYTQIKSKFEIVPQGKRAPPISPSVVCSLSIGAFHSHN